MLIKWFSNVQTHGSVGNNSRVSIDRSKPANNNVGLHTGRFMRMFYNHISHLKQQKNTKGPAH